MRLEMEGYVEADITNWTQEVSKSTILIVVYFWHEQYAYCMRLNPIFNEIARSTREK
jgi:thioredoxin-like negative regulator of GroEL